MKNTESSAEKKKPALEVLVLDCEVITGDIRQYINKQLTNMFESKVDFLTCYTSFVGLGSGKPLADSQIFGNLNGKLYEINVQRLDLVILGDHEWDSTSFYEVASALKERNPAVHMVGFSESLSDYKLKKVGLADRVDHLDRVEELEGYITDLLKQKSGEK